MGMGESKHILGQWAGGSWSPKEKLLLNVTMVLALEPSMGMIESSRLFSVPLLPLLFAAQAAGLRLGDRQPLGEFWQKQGVLACIFQLGSWGQQSIFHFCDMHSLGSRLVELVGGGARGGTIACKEPKDYHRNQPVGSSQGFFSF